MIGFEVCLNGDRLYTAGVGEAGVMTAGVTWVFRTAPGVSRRSDLRLEVGGMSREAHHRWPTPRKLAVGDVVTVRIVDTKSPDRPTSTKRDDAKLVEAAERKYYERLKAKFEKRTRRSIPRARRRRTRG